MHEVLISYEFGSGDIADTVCSKLERNGIRCWYAPRDLGACSPEAETKKNAMDAARVFVLILSKDSSGSENVKTDLKMALDRQKEGSIIILRVGNDISDEIKRLTNGITAIDVSDSHLDVSIETLVKRVNELLQI